MAEQTWMTIGALSRATGVPTETLRTWERRYGFPASARTESGHRRYSLQTVARVRLVTQLLELGHRPSAVLAADEAVLRQLLAQSGAAERVLEPATASAADQQVVRQWLGHVARYEGLALDRALRTGWNELGARPFVEHRIAPFLEQLGERWERGELGVGHEHFASERLREFLSVQWRPLSDAAGGAPCVLATLPGEHHVLGLHLVALTVALAGRRVVFLGANTPPEEIAGAALQHASREVLLSAAVGCDEGRSTSDLERLRQLLPDNVELGLGGRGFDAVLGEGRRFPDLAGLERWLRERA